MVADEDVRQRIVEAGDVHEDAELDRMENAVRRSLPSQRRERRLYSAASGPCDFV